MGSRFTPLITQLRYRSHSGRAIRQHRALRRFHISRANLVEILILPLLLSAAGVLAIGEITSFWNASLALLVDRLGFDTAFDNVVREVAGWRVYELAVPRLAGYPPTAGAAAQIAVITAALMLGTYLFMRQQLPVAYFAWAVGSVIGITLLYLRLRPGQFPHTITSHLRSELELAVAFLFAVPWLLAVSYYVFDFGLLRKLACTVLIVGYIALYTPLQYTLHLLILHYGSVAFMPALFVFGGVLVDVLIFIALYAWAMSWKSRQ